LSQGKEEKNFSKVNERSGNVDENKGSAFHRLRQSGNVIENKDSYGPEAGILVKINDLVVVHGNNHE